MKKLISFLMALIAAALAANASAPVLAPPSRVLDIDLEACDVNQDGMVNISDISTWLNAARNGDFSSGRYDVNSDGVVNYIDYACIYYTITQDDSMPTEDQCDFDGNGKVNVNDWVLIFDAWKNGTNEDPFDLNHDGSVNYVDLGMMALLLAELENNSSILKLAFSESEIWLAPGESMEVHIVLQSMDETVISGGFEFDVYDSNRNLVNSEVVLDDCYGENQWFFPEGPSSPDVNAYNLIFQSNPEAGDYRMIFVDGTVYEDGSYRNGYWPLGSFSCPVNVFAFTVHASEGWNDQYATIELNRESPASGINGTSGIYYFTEPMILTVKNKAGTPRTDAPVITSELYYDYVEVSAIGDGEVSLYLEGELVENPYYVPRTDVDQTITFSATAHEEGKQISETAILVVTVPAMDLPTSDAPVITAEVTADAVTVTAFGNGEVKLYRNGFEVDNPCVIPRTDVDCTFTFTATCKEEGKLISDVVTMTVLVPAMEQPSGDGISIYVKADQAPYLYSWDSSGSLCGDWPGTRLYDIETINRVDYYVYHFDKDMVNVIFNNGGGSQTGDFTNITHDAYFIYNGSDLAYGLIPPQVYGNPTGEYAFYVNTDGWDQVYAEVNGHSYPMTKVGVDGAGFEVYKWEASGLNYTPTTITFNDGAGRGVQDAYGNIYSREYVKGGYYIYSFYQTYYIVRLDMVTTIVYDDSSQRPALEDCSITLNSSNDEWNGYVNIEFQISGTYFSQQARQGSVWYSIDGNEWVEFTSLLNSEQQFDETVSISFNSYNDYHSLRIIARDQSGAFSESVYLLQAVVDASSLECENLPYVEYTGQPITFVPQVYDINHNPCYVDQDFTYSFENNVDAGTALLNIQGIYPNCIGNATIEFTINPHTISGDVHTVGEWFYYTGSAITPEVIVTDAAFGTLIEGQDYVVTYENNNQVGTGRAIVDGIGNFAGHFVLEFEIIGIPGDVNYTGTVDITDLQAMVMYIFGEYNRPFNFTAADLNEDQVVNVQDVVGEANILLNGNQLTMSSGGRRMPAIGDDTQASLYWENGVLYLYSTVPVAALDIINNVDGDIKWSLGARGMVVVNAPCDEGEHSVIYSLSDGVIPAGLTAIATATDQNATVVSAMLSDTDAELVSVKFNDSMTGLTGINSDGGVSCNMEGSDLVINSGAALRDVDVTIYSIDGRIVDNQHLSSLNSGRTKLDVSNVSDGNRYLIIVVRSGRQILATQKLTQNK